MRRHAARAAVALLAFLVVTGPALADWTASGTFNYVDREYDSTGFTGAEVPSPIRFADFEVVDANLSGKRSVLAEGATDGNGNFSVVVNDSKTRDVLVRVVSTSSNTADLNQDVRQNTGGKAVYYAAASAAVTGHGSTTNVDFGAVNIPVGGGGEIFNIFDQILRGADYVGSMEGARPPSGSHMTVVWGENNGVSNSFYDTTSSHVVLRDTAGYDDTVIIHEMGHHIIREYSQGASAGGAHTFATCDVDIRLAFEEGWASFFGNSALRHHGLAGSNIYTRTDGSPGAGGLIRFADLETDTQYFCEGAAGEVVVFSVLWDIVDGPSTPDLTPGVDDGHDSLDLPDSDVWEVMTAGLPGSVNISMETFWDKWFLPPASNGSRTAMIAIADHHGVDYFEDLHEVNDTAAQAPTVPADGSATSASFFRDPEADGAGAEDFDYFAFNASSGQSYSLETANLKSDGNTTLRLYDSDGTTVLALNNDRSGNDESSLINWVAPRTDQFFLRVNHSADIGIYGSYDLVVTAQIPSDDDGDGYDTTTDCDDTDPNINPGATEVCDGVDQDCDSVVDNGFDGDGDGFTTCAGDCNDADPNVNPGVPEVPSNGIDDNCNGQTDEVPATDTVTITSAVWKKGPKKLTVKATSDQQPGVTLTVVGFGVMTWDAANAEYTYTSPRNTPNPGTVTVDSSGGGSDTASVQ